MSDTDTSYDLGYRKPPKHAQYVKGRSGNPKGRPRGSQNLDTILMKVARERVKVTINGVTRQISKLEAGVMQLFNKAAAGDPRAIREALTWYRSCCRPQNEIHSPVGGQADTAVLESLLKRIRQSEPLFSDLESDSAALTEIESKE